MKQITFILLLYLGTSCFSQNNEFNKFNNGLIYSDTTVQQLKFIVDSLNLKFKVCELNKIYFSKAQAKAHFVSLEKGKIKKAKKDMEAGISFDDFTKKYGNAKIEKELLVVKFKYKDYDENDVINFSSLELNKKYEHEFEFEKHLNRYDGPQKGKWVYRYYEKSKYSEESIDAFYFIEEFSQHALPETYAKKIQYSDCMVDTSARIFYEKVHRGGSRYSNEASLKTQAFLDYIHTTTNRPEYQGEYNEKEYEVYWKKFLQWDSLRLAKVDSLKSKDEKFTRLLNEAVNEASLIGGSDDEFEEYVGRYVSKKTELELKRNRIVVGGCSQDDSPRMHALNIAKLSAETINWEIFLRSHLDIMNDRFERASDGSYAWGKRKTYIKELEVLDINVLDLLLGICLRIENPSDNHYYGSIGRIGRALSETDRSSEIESKMLQMISDNQLDDYNRILMYYLFLNYNYNIDDKEKQETNKNKLKDAVKKLPEYLALKISATN
jgi:hypothetical protein